MPSRAPFGLLALLSLLCVGLMNLVALGPVAADGKVMPPRDYKGSLEELAQEAIIIFHGSEKEGGAVQDLILKISVQGEAKNFSWVVPFPTEPKAEAEAAKLFKECFDYVQARTVKPATKNGKRAEAKADEPTVGVDVLSREIVGSYDVAVVKETEAGALDKWLDKEGFQTLGKDAEDVVGEYRRKGYCFACMKVNGAELQKDKPVDLHPLRFTFKTGGRDGIYFPMRMTGLQKDPFDVNLYVFYGKWLNDKLSKYGYVHRGFSLNFRDFDSRSCTPNAGKAWSAPESDPYLKAFSGKMPTLTKLFQKLHPGEKYYLTNIQARGIKPADVRAWKDDLWLFPYYTDENFVPFDARKGGVAAAAWPE
ncbi:MAG TPA: DUF2330 domain-containing protein [Planctomycetota bacterium]|nr:DUF2330 domain-containing protein [Planctomycetota bacterium]